MPYRVCNFELRRDFSVDLSVQVEGISNVGIEVCKFMNQVVVVDFDGVRLFNALGNHGDFLQNDGQSEILSVAFQCVLTTLHLLRRTLTEQSDHVIKQNSLCALDGLW